MRSISVRRTGGPEVMQLDEHEPHPLRTGEVRVEVAAAGVNFIDIYERSGTYPRGLPYVPGDEGSGRVVAAAPDVAELAIGDRVAWRGIPGSYASQVRASANRFIRVPPRVTDEQAAALPVQGLTAHFLSSDSFPIGAGDTVVIHAGAGGVGLLLTQMAKHRNARVITTVSGPEKAEMSRAAGSDLVVGYRELTDAVRSFTGGVGAAAVYDGVGRATLRSSLDVLARRGTLVVFGSSSGKPPSLDLDELRTRGSLTVTRPTLKDFVTNAGELRRRATELYGWVDQGLLNVHIGGRYPLAEAARAHTDLANRHTVGKLLLIP